ncbi:MAG: primosomal protein [Gammaproteobacteria bacterium]|nr:primosomal protein [Gammaproteobacteria bacterium]
MKLIAEYTDTDLGYSITEDAKSGKKNVFIEGVFMSAESKNRNGRIYSKKVLEKAIEKYNQDQVITGRAVGELNHPDGPSINLDKVSHRITELKWDGNNVMGKALVLDTPMGQVVKGLVEGGVQLGVSSRGMGSLESKNGANYVKDDFLLNTVDIVQDPSAQNAFVNGIYEGTNWSMDEEGHFIPFKTVEEGETEMMEPEVVEEEPIVEEIVDNSKSEIAGFEHFLSKL